jgi:hypothetical protein
VNQRTEVAPAQPSHEIGDLGRDLGNLGDLGRDLGNLGDLGRDLGNLGAEPSHLGRDLGVGDVNQRTAGADKAAALKARRMASNPNFNPTLTPTVTVTLTLTLTLDLTPTLTLTKARRMESKAEYARRSPSY